jgi:Flp pilus assembly protein TadG
MNVRGAALVEFAFVAALMLVIVFGLIDFSRGFGLKHRAAALSREAANLASRGMPLTEVVDTIVSAAKPVDLTNEGAVILSRLENEEAGSGFVIKEQRKGGAHNSRLGSVDDPVDIPDAGNYPAGSVLFAGEVFVNFESVTPFSALSKVLLPEEIYESTVFFGSAQPPVKPPPPGPPPGRPPPGKPLPPVKPPPGGPPPPNPPVKPPPPVGPPPPNPPPIPPPG